PPAPDRTICASRSRPASGPWPSIFARQAGLTVVRPWTASPPRPFIRGAEAGRNPVNARERYADLALYAPSQARCIERYRLNTPPSGGAVSSTESTRCCTGSPASRSRSRAVSTSPVSVFTVRTVSTMPALIAAAAVTRESFPPDKSAIGFPAHHDATDSERTIPRAPSARDGTSPSSEEVIHSSRSEEIIALPSSLVETIVLALI